MDLIVVTKKQLASLACKYYLKGMDAMNAKVSEQASYTKELEAENKKLKAERDTWREKAIAYKLLCKTFASDGGK